MNKATIPPAEEQVFKRAVKLMGNRFEISVVESCADSADDHIAAAIEEISRIERLLSTFQPNSQVNEINRYAGIRPVEVDAELLQLIQRSNRISSLTQGAFDISYGSIDKRFWNFDTSMTSLPDPDAARQAVHLIDYRNIEVDPLNQTVFLTQKGMRIGFGGIGKGYAADKAKALLQDRGIDSGIVNASGDLTAWGTQPNGEIWTIGIANPNAANHLFSYINITDMSVATSGNYEKYITINGKRYSHTIDPRSGMPVTGIKSVTIISPYAELSDALATPVTVMGVKAGIDLLNQLQNVAALIIDDNNRLITTHNIQLV